MHDKKMSSSQEAVIQRSHQLRKANKDVSVALRILKDKQAAADEARRLHSEAVDFDVRQSGVPP